MGVVKADALGGTISREVPARTLEERFRAGDEGALDEVIRVYEGRIRRLVYRLAGWEGGEVDDVVQEVFIVAVTSARKFDGRSSLGTWLTSVAINKCRSERRRRVLRGRYWKRLAGERRNVEAGKQAVEASERAGRVVEEVRKLSGKYREVVVLRYLEGMEIEEVGKVLGISRGAVEVRLHRAREVLRGTLADVWKE
jgi:RNA polymerase sigma-70 factor (ECF subfamily)